MRRRTARPVLLSQKNLSQRNGCRVCGSAQGPDPGERTAATGSGKLQLHRTGTQQRAVSQVKTLTTSFKKCKYEMAVHSNNQHHLQPSQSRAELLALSVQPALLWSTTSHPTHRKSRWRYLPNTSTGYSLPRGKGKVLFSGHHLHQGIQATITNDGTNRHQEPPEVTSLGILWCSCQVCSV